MAYVVLAALVIAGIGYLFQNILTINSGSVLYRK